MKTIIKIYVLVSLLTVISCSNDIDGESPDLSVGDIENFEGEFGAKEFESIEKSRFHNFIISREDAFNPILGEVSGSSTLIRGNRAIWARYRAEKLIKGHTYTLWWVIWNKPENCETPGQCVDTDLSNPAVEVELMYASGAVAKNNGKATFYSYLRAGDDSESINELFGLPLNGGLQEGNTFNAEVHLVVRSHGPAIPGQIYQQISSYTGGCNNPFEIQPFTEIPNAEGECADIEFSVHPPLN